MQKPEIRPEEPRDHPRVYEVQHLAFGTPLQADLVETLRQSAEPTLSLVALIDGVIVGHIFFSPVTLDSAELAAAQLSPVAVVPDLQSQGVGSALIRAGLDGCAAKGWAAVFLVGNPAYYSRFGFRMANAQGLHCAGAEDPFLQCLALQPNALAAASGMVRFHPAFDDLED